ncbi:MAG: LptF/LptG family permease [Elusimicrobiota bacterium]|jgi:lipopolysaccharide export LptBFGC system permease protein LptF|nr:LptF/LptG family permease [Elusimicrobiota bacterium]
MIKKIHIYIIKEFSISFFFGTAVFSILLLLDQVFNLLNILLSKGVEFFIVLKLFCSFFPNILVLSIPMATLFGVLISYGRLSDDNEITALKASGIDYKTLTMPVFILIFLISSFLLVFNHFLSPSIHSNFRSIYEDILIRKPLIKFEEKSIIDIGEYHIYVNKIDNEKNVLNGIGIYKFEQNNKATNNKNILPHNDSGSWRISASSASVAIGDNEVQLTLHKGYWQRIDSKEMNRVLHTTFKTYFFFIPLETITKTNSRSASEMSSAEILEIIKENKKNKTPHIAYEREFWIRFVFAFAPIAFVLIALPIGITVNKGGKGISFGMSLAIILIYYILLIISLNLAENGYAKTGVILWLPNIAISLFGACFMFKTIKK